MEQQSKLQIESALRENQTSGHKTSIVDVLTYLQQVLSYMSDIYYNFFGRDKPMSRAGNTFRRIAKQLDELMAIIAPHPQRIDVIGQLEAMGETLSGTSRVGRSLDVISKILRNKFHNAGGPLSKYLTFLTVKVDPTRFGRYLQAIVTEEDIVNIALLDMLLGLEIPNQQERSWERKMRGQVESWKITHPGETVGNMLLDEYPTKLGMSRRLELASKAGATFRLEHLPSHILFPFKPEMENILEKLRSISAETNVLVIEQTPLGDYFRDLASQLDDLQQSVTAIRVACHGLLTSSVVEFAQLVLNYLTGDSVRTWNPVEEMVMDINPSKTTLLQVILPEIAEIPRPSGKETFQWGFPTYLSLLRGRVTAVMFECVRLNVIETSRSSHSTTMQLLLKDQTLSGTFSLSPAQHQGLCASSYLLSDVDRRRLRPIEGWGMYCRSTSPIISSIPLFTVHIVDKQYKFSYREDVVDFVQCLISVLTWLGLDPALYLEGIEDTNGNTYQMEYSVPQSHP